MTESAKKKNGTSPPTSERLLRLPEVLAITGRSRSALLRDIEEGRFPAPVKIGPRSVAWHGEQVIEWKDKLRGGSAHDVR